MSYRDELLASIGDKIAQIRDIADDFQQIARDSERFLDRYREKRSNPNRPDRLPAYPDRKPALRIAAMSEQDTIVDFGFGDEFTQDMNHGREPCPGTEVSRGRYESRLLKVLDGLRQEVRRYDEFRALVSPTAREENLRRLRKSLDLVRKVQTLLNRTGSWNFLLADPS